MQPVNFPYIDRPKKITLEATTKALTTSFKEATITQLLTELSKQPEFIALEELRGRPRCLSPSASDCDIRATSSSQGTISEVKIEADRAGADKF